MLLPSSSHHPASLGSVAVHSHVSEGSSLHTQLYFSGVEGAVLFPLTSVRVLEQSILPQALHPIIPIFKNELTIYFS